MIFFMKTYKRTEKMTYNPNFDFGASLHQFIYQGTVVNRTYQAIYGGSQ